MKKSRRERIIKESFKKQAGLCALCGALLGNLEETNLDHKIPVSKGGDNTRKNLQLTHRRCNENRGNRESLIFYFNSK